MRISDWSSDVCSSDLASGLTRGADWQAACTAAAAVPRGGAADFFAQWFSPVQVGDGKAFATGYYIPEIHGAREKRRGYEVPIYGRPANLVDVDLGQFTDTDRKSTRLNYSH